MLEELLAAAAKDKEVDALRKQLLRGFPASLKQCTDEVRPYFQFQHELSEVDGVIICRMQQMIVPLSLCGRYLHLAHSSHDGMVRTK